MMFWIMPGHLAMVIVAGPKYCYRESGRKKLGPKTYINPGPIYLFLYLATDDDSKRTVEIFIAKDSRL